MTTDDTDNSGDAIVPERTNWAERVRFSRRGGGYAHRPGEIHCADRRALRIARALTGSSEAEPIEVEDGSNEWIHRFDGDVDDVVEQLRDRGVRAEPNYVLFANPMYANPMYANPVSASPVYANPVVADPVYANTYICTGERPSTARPARAPEAVPEPYQPGAVQGPKVVVLDTGISEAKWCPPMLSALATEYPGQGEVPDGSEPAKPKDGFLDPSSGHGTFIAGLIHALAPGQRIVPVRVVSSYGDVAVSDVVKAIRTLLRQHRIDDRTVVNLSFGGYADEHMAALARAVRRLRKAGAAVVASAGNDATSRPMFPACLPGVVGVAALDPYGPAAYTNHGPWVSACAPGTDLVAAFYEYDGQAEVPAKPGSGDPDDYQYWARWTGTSFAAPVVSAALVRHMRLLDTTAEDAVASVIDAPGLFRLHDLGTVVNLVPPDPGCI